MSPAGRGGAQSNTGRGHPPPAPPPRNRILCPIGPRSGDLLLFLVLGIAQHVAAAPDGFDVIVAASRHLDLLAQLAARQIGQVIELRPGIMETDMTAGVKEKYDKLILRDERGDQRPALAKGEIRTQLRVERNPNLRGIVG